mmetsp:Transcript_47483/g.133625  ORF Transcript_47483/g.133625 Transcript_47483/m.133625 type:complete len:206 (+) Transcript_47483:739-1356(+)
MPVPCDDFGDFRGIISSALSSTSSAMSTILSAASRIFCAQPLNISTRCSRTLRALVSSSSSESSSSVVDAPSVACLPLCFATSSPECSESSSCPPEVAWAIASRTESQPWRKLPTKESVDGAAGPASQPLRRSGEAGAGEATSRGATGAEVAGNAAVEGGAMRWGGAAGKVPPGLARRIICCGVWGGNRGWLAVGAGCGTCGAGA